MQFKTFLCNIENLKIEGENNMKNILLVCAAGMSTSIVVKRMKEEAEKRNIEATIQAMSIAESSSIIEKQDVVLLGPQVRFQKKQVEEMSKGQIPVDVIDIQAYGLMNGAAVLDQALNLLEKTDQT